MSQSTANMDRGGIIFDCGRCPLRPHPPPPTLLPPRRHRSLLPPAPPPRPTILTRSSQDSFRTALELKKKGESHDHRPSPRFDFAISFDLRRNLFNRVEIFLRLRPYAPRSLRSSLACCSASLATRFASVSGSSHGWPWSGSAACRRPSLAHGQIYVGQHARHFRAQTVELQPSA